MSDRYREYLDELIIKEALTSEESLREALTTLEPYLVRKVLDQLSESGPETAQLISLQGVNVNPEELLKAIDLDFTNSFNEALIKMMENTVLPTIHSYGSFTEDLRSKESKVAHEISKVFNII